MLEAKHHSPLCEHVNRWTELLRDPGWQRFAIDIAMHHSMSQLETYNAIQSLYLLIISVWFANNLHFMYESPSPVWTSNALIRKVHCWISKGLLIPCWLYEKLPPSPEPHRNTKPILLEERMSWLNIVSHHFYPFIFIAVHISNSVQYTSWNVSTFLCVKGHPTTTKANRIIQQQKLRGKNYVWTV